MELERLRDQLAGAGQQTAAGGAGKVGLCRLPAGVPELPPGLQISTEMRQLATALLTGPSAGLRVAFHGMVNTARSATAPRCHSCRLCAIALTDSISWTHRCGWSGAVCSGGDRKDDHQRLAGPARRCPLGLRYHRLGPARADPVRVTSFGILWFAVPFLLCSKPLRSQEHREMPEGAAPAADRRGAQVRAQR